MSQSSIRKYPKSVGQFHEDVFCFIQSEHVFMQRYDYFMYSYEPELFPGLIYRMVKPRIVLLIFVSGKVVLTGECCSVICGSIYKTFLQTTFYSDLSLCYEKLALYNTIGT